MELASDMCKDGRIRERHHSGIIRHAVGEMKAAGKLAEDDVHVLDMLIAVRRVASG